jgi:hypothetical protein
VGRFGTFVNPVVGFVFGEVQGGSGRNLDTHPLQKVDQGGDS